MSDDRLVAAIEAAERWATLDPDPATRSALDRMVIARDPALIALFDGRLAFGTAGLRAPVGPGPNRMNAMIVRQTTAAVVEWLRQMGGVPKPTILIGFDARTNSADFAHHGAAAVLAAQGRPRLADGALPTPVVAHAMREAQADAAFVITASHNPPADNGYKLYAGDGLQIVPPAEHEISRLIDEVSGRWVDYSVAIDDVLAEVALAEQGSAAAWTASHRKAAVAEAGVVQPDRAVKVVYTAMHGVGGGPTLAAFAEAGLDAPIVVESQFAPDPTFPTVSFPNPEEPGALDEAIRVATDVGADLILAHDPDADRLAMAAPTSTGEMRTLSGDELGVLFGDYLLRRLGDESQSALVARSVVSSRLLDQIARACGAMSVATLTGFKWVARAADDVPDRRWCFGYEEAIGYCVGTHVRDKDGITAALVAVTMVHELTARGLTVWDRLDELATEHGLYASLPVSVRFDQHPSALEVIAEIVDRIASAPPDALGGSPVANAGPIGGGALPPTAGIELHSDDGTRVIVRPSGTEPKVKAYIEVIESVDPAAGGVAAARADAQAKLETIAAQIEALLST